MSYEVRAVSLTFLIRNAIELIDPGQKMLRGSAVGLLQELLELSDGIGYESTGLKEKEMLHCLGKAKTRMEEMLPLLLHAAGEWKCSICQVSCSVKHLILLLLLFY